MSRVAAASTRGTGWFAAGAVLAAVAVAVAALLAGDAPYRAVGSNDPGPLVAVGTPVLRLVADLAATVCLGALAFVACCTRGTGTGGNDSGGNGAGGTVSARAFRELRVAAAAAGVWTLAALGSVVFSAANTAGTALRLDVLPQTVAAVEEPKAWLVTAVLAAVLCRGALSALRWRTALWLLGGAVLAVLPPLMTGHASADTGHDLSLAALGVHVPAAALWLGMLLAVLRDRGPGRAAALRRYATVAGWCWLLVLASGLVLGGVLGNAGAPLVVKLAATVLLGAAAFAVRGRALRGWLRRRRAPLLVAELGLLLVAFAASVDLAHLPLPRALNRAITTTQTLLGYDLAGPPTPGRLLLDWRPDLVFAPLAVLLFAGYLAGVRRLRACGAGWSTWRTVAWSAGCLVLLLATSSGLGRYAAAMFSAHIASHMLVSMTAPALLVLGGPLELVRTAWPRGQLRRCVDALTSSPAVRALTHPAVAAALFAGAPFVLYLTGIFDAAVRFHWAHVLIDGVFLAIGYLFLWPAIGVDPAPRRLPSIARLGMLIAAMPADVVLGAVFLTTGTVIGNGVAGGYMYEALALPWVTDLLADQRVAGVVGIGIAEVTLLGALAVLLLRWERADAAAGMSQDAGLERYRAALREARSTEARSGDTRSGSGTGGR